VRGLDPTLKSARLANYLLALRKDLLQLAHACGQVHPALVPLDRLDLLDGLVRRSAPDAFGYAPTWGLPPARDREAIAALMAAASADADRGALGCGRCPRCCCGSTWR
jgi:hypothetical protein